MSNVKDFSRFKAPPGIPIIGQGQPPAQPSILRDAQGRKLRVGDWIDLRDVFRPMFQIVSITKFPATELPPNSPPLLRVELRAGAVYGSEFNAPNAQFMLTMTKEEVDAQRANQYSEDIRRGQSTKSEVGEAQGAASASEVGDGAGATGQPVSESPAVGDDAARAELDLDRFEQLSDK